MRVILLGPPGAGKGTQAVSLSQATGLPHISTGDMFRAALKEGTALGREAKKYMEKGELVPDEVVVAMVRERIQQADCARGFILDGFPRTLQQARKLDETLAGAGQGIDVVLNMVCSTGTILQRLTGRRVCRVCGAIFHVQNMPPKVAGVCDACGGELYQRDDDKEETIMNRLEVYHRATSGLIEYYRERGVLREVNADAPREATLAEMLAVMKNGKG
ncbi:MAG: adenylate kinase, partial [bacterium]|nr:adenylate kinase [bacterium]